MSTQSGRIVPDHVELVGIVVIGLIFLAMALQRLDDPTSRQGIATMIGTFGVFLLFLWYLYAKPTSELTLPALWLGVSLLVIVGIIAGAVLSANWPIDRELVANFAPVLAIGVVLALVYVARSMLNR